MNLYHIWCNLRQGIKDLDFVKTVENYLGHLQSNGKIEKYRITRRKLGFGPPNLGEWHIVIECRDLSQLDGAFNQAAARDGETEKLHAPVYSSVCDLSFALYRDFPDEVRTGSAK